MSSVGPGHYFFSAGRKAGLLSFFAFFAARFSFKDMAGFFIPSFLVFRSFDMVILRMRVDWYQYLHTLPIHYSGPL